MQKSLCALTGLLLAGSLCALETAGCKPGSDGTLIRWKNPSPGARWVLIRRSPEKITAENRLHAESLRAEAKAGQALFPAGNGGTCFYLLSELDEHGRETCDYSNQTGPVEETARRPLTPVRFRMEIRDGKFLLIRDDISLLNPERIVKFRLKTRDGRTVAEQPLDKPEFVLPAANSGQWADYTVCPVDSNGREGEGADWFRYGDFPDFRICAVPNPAQNEDVELQTRYPLVGTANRVGFRITNAGGKAGKAIVSVTGRTDREITLEPGKSTVLSGEWKPEKAGRHPFRVEIACEADRTPENNRLDLILHAVEKPVHFIWYGSAANLAYATAGANEPAHWKRIGGRSLRITGRTVSADHFRKMFAPDNPYLGMQYDELGGKIKPETYLKALREFRQTHPKVFVALWHIGSRPSPAIVQAVKEGTVDLLLPEIYYTWNGKIDGLKGIIERFRKLGILEKTVFGLGTASNYAGWGTAEQHAEYLEKQIALIREFAPESPGLAFYSSSTLPGVKAKVDDLCRKYYLEEGGSK
ncbi:MAG: hypothetical protein IJS14_01360 [Lentisphaeria bacterium]|nr:hypothetical protein [Lentisphaeria bacterium]